jgi:flagellar biosynthesis chaperone FliJ
MSADRVRRADRVVELRKGAVELAQAACATAAQAAHEAAQAARDAEAEWTRASLAASSAAWASSADLAESSAWIRTLKGRAERAAMRADEARREVDRTSAALVAARSELRRMEMWRDGLVAADRAILDRKERVAADEIAARTARRQS